MSGPVSMLWANCDHHGQQYLEHALVEDPETCQEELVVDALVDAFADLASGIWFQPEAASEAASWVAFVDVASEAASEVEVASYDVVDAELAANRKGSDARMFQEPGR